jgi:hypothetical protein
MGSVRRPCRRSARPPPHRWRWGVGGRGGARPT